MLVSNGQRRSLEESLLPTAELLRQSRGLRDRYGTHFQHVLELTLLKVSREDFKSGIFVSTTPSEALVFSSASRS